MHGSGSFHRYDLEAEKVKQMDHLFYQRVHDAKGGLMQELYLSHIQ